MFKKLPFILMTLTFVLVLAACGSKTTQAQMVPQAMEQEKALLLLNSAGTSWLLDLQRCNLW